jgi:hypothetical protein
MLGVPVATRGVGCLGGGLALVAVGALKHAIANNMVREERQAQGPAKTPQPPLSLRVRATLLEPLVRIFVGGTRGA